MLYRLIFLALLVAGVIVGKEMADGCGMNPLMALVAVADKTGKAHSPESLAHHPFNISSGRLVCCLSKPKTSI